ncbi:hypothetical protein FA95DRAFT_1563235 [Auriscalpium vulgare]|uniref:Uncharacterized protein n=1 Tax=Auriscalpium vulgare TaxID=40419 RepID=A0ACB8RIA2_9AGAM|nr:hypothetical protein FA95DRAFT_1563235 [Auriscalpium vulgare]
MRWVCSAFSPVRRRLATCSVDTSCAVVQHLCLTQVGFSAPLSWAIRSHVLAQVGRLRGFSQWSSLSSSDPSYPVGLTFALRPVLSLALGATALARHLPNYMLTSP